MKQEFRAFFKKATIQGEKAEMLLSALSDAAGVFDACRMSGKTVIVTVEEIQQELPIDQERSEPDGMDELPIDQPSQPSVTVNNYYAYGTTGEVSDGPDDSRALPGWVDTSAYEAEVDADIAEVDAELSEGGEE